MARLTADSRPAVSATGENPVAPGSRPGPPGTRARPRPEGTPSMGEVVFLRRRPPTCRCGVAGRLQGCSAREHWVLRTRTGLSGETREGLPVVRAVLIRRRLVSLCPEPLGETIEQIWQAAYLCPWGAEPKAVVLHGWAPGTDRAGAAKLSSCPHLNAPAELWIEAVDLGLPARALCDDASGGRR